MSGFTVYLVGYVIFLIGLGVVLHLIGLGWQWSGAILLIFFGLGVASAVKRTRKKR